MYKYAHANWSWIVNGNTTVSDGSRIVKAISVFKFWEPYRVIG